MSDQIKDEEIKDEEGKEKEKGSELTLEALASTVKAQNELIATMKAEGVNSIAQLQQIMEEKYGLMSDDMKNISTMLGGLANPDDNINTEEDVSTPEGINKVMDKREKSKKEMAEKENKAYWAEYGEAYRELVEEDGPDGKPLNQEAKDGIKKLLLDTVTEKTTNAIRDAHKNFKKATKIYFGLDRTHGFKGEDLDGTGGGNSESKGGGKKTYTFTPEQIKEFTAIGETEEWARKVMEKREKEKATAY